MTNSKQPMADRVAAHNAGQYDAELVGTRYEGAKMVSESNIGQGVNIFPNKAQRQLDGDAPKLAAKVAILSDMLGECIESIESHPKFKELFSPYCSNNSLEGFEVANLKQTLTNAKLVREMK